MFFRAVGSLYNNNNCSGAPTLTCSFDKPIAIDYPQIPIISNIQEVIKCSSPATFSLGLSVSFDVPGLGNQSSLSIPPVTAPSGQCLGVPSFTIPIINQDVDIPYLANISCKPGLLIFLVPGLVVLLLSICICICACYCGCCCTCCRGVSSSSPDAGFSYVALPQSIN